MAGNPAAVLSAMSINPYSVPAAGKANVQKLQARVFYRYQQQSQKIESLIHNMQTAGRFSPNYLDLKVAALRDQQQIDYVLYRQRAQLMDPSIAPKDRQALIEKTKQLIVPLQAEMAALNQGAAKVLQMQPASSPQAQPTPTPGFVPASGFVPSEFQPANP
jgi:hypothetical protein